MTRLLFPILLGFGECAGPTTDTATCTSTEPCPEVTGFSCEAGAESVEPFEGGLVHAMSAVYVVGSSDEIEPWDAWTQDTDGVLRFICPGETTPGSGWGNVLVYYYEM